MPSRRDRTSGGRLEQSLAGRGTVPGGPSMSTRPAKSTGSQGPADATAGYEVRSVPSALDRLRSKRRSRVVPPTRFNTKVGSTRSVGDSTEIRSVTAVRVVLRACRKPGAHGILVDVSNKGEEVRVRLAQERLVPALEHVAHLAVSGVEALSVGLLKALHEPIEGRLGRGEHEVHVVGHQAVGKEAHGVSRPVHPEPVEIGVVVARDRGIPPPGDCRGRRRGKGDPDRGARGCRAMLL